MQWLVTVLIVFVAAAWLLRRAWITLRSAIGGGVDSPIGSCHGCSKNRNAATIRPLVSIGAKKGVEGER